MEKKIQVKNFEGDEVGICMVTDAVAGIMHGALDMGLTFEDVMKYITLAFMHVKAERSLIKSGICSKCERPFKAS